MYNLLEARNDHYRGIRILDDGTGMRGCPIIIYERSNKTSPNNIKTVNYAMRVTEDTVVSIFNVYDS